MGKTIEELADDYCKSTLVGSQYVRKNSYIQGAKDVLQEVIATISVSDDEWLRDNLSKLILELKGNLQFDNGTIEDNLDF